jgi:hypothetical protein
MNVGSEMIDLHEDGWTKWLAEEVFLPFIDKKIEIKEDESTDDK